MSILKYIEGAIIDMNGDSGKSRDFEEITLAITILTGLSFILFKTSDYFNNNTIGLSDILQTLISTFVSGLLIELVIISSFLILKGYLLFAKTRETAIISIADAIFNYFFLYFVFLGVYSIFLLFFIIILHPTLNERPYYIYLFIFIAYTVFTLYATFRVASYLGGSKKGDFIKSVNNFLEIFGKFDLEKRIIVDVMVQYLRHQSIKNNSSFYSA